MKAGAIPPEEYQARLRRVREGMGRRGLDALLLYANRTHPGHVRYLTGYEPRLGIHDSAACLVTPTRCALLTNAGFDRPATQTWLQDAVVTADYAAAALELLPRDVRRMGVAGYPALPTPIYLGLRQKLADAEFLDASDLVLGLRRVKSPAEIALLREAARVTDAGGQAFWEFARPGITEREVLVQVEAAMKRAGSDEVSFATQVCSGPRTAQVVAFATDRVLGDGGLVQLDCGGTVQGYRGDLSRVAFLGEPRGRLRGLLQVTVEMYERCLEQMRPGVSCGELARLAVAIAERYGLGGCLYQSPNHARRFFGHGIGCSYTEPPEIEPDSDVRLGENMVIVLEPILCDAAVGGVKLEDAVLITAGAPERLSRLPVHLAR
jgi:Xaa-Pro aminopeptidase